MEIQIGANISAAITALKQFSSEVDKTGGVTSATASKVGESFGKIIEASKRLNVGVSNNLSSIDLSKKFEDATARIHATIDQSVNAALGLGQAFPVAIVPAIKSLDQLQAEMDELKIKIATATNVSDIQKLSIQFGALQRQAVGLTTTFRDFSSLKIASASFPADLVTRVQAFGGGVQRLSPVLDSVSGKLSTKLPQASNASTLALINLGRVVQDAPFGFLGIANNLNPLLESFQRLKAQSGSTGGALSALGGSLKGAGGLGIAISVVSSLLIVFGDKLFASTKQFDAAKEKVDRLKNKYEELQKKLVELSTTTKTDLIGESGSEFEKAFKSIKTLTENIDLAKKGFIGKKEVVNQYNKELGEAIGKVKTLDEVEKKIAEKGEAYLKFTLLKAAAQQALAKASNAALIVAENEAKIFNAPLLKAKQDDNIGAPIADRFNKLSDGINKGTRKVISEAKTSQERFIQIFKQFQDDAAAIAKTSGIVFNEGDFDPKVAKGPKAQFNFFDKFFDVKPANIEKQIKEMADLARDFARKHFDIFEGLEGIIGATSEKEIVEAGKKFWVDYQKGVLRFKPVKFDISLVPSLVPDVKTFDVDLDKLREQFISSISKKEKDVPFFLLTPSGNSVDQILDTYKTLFGQLKSKLPKVIDVTDAFGNVQSVDIGDVFNIADLDKGLKKLLENIKAKIIPLGEQVRETINGVFGQFFQEGFEGIGEGIGNALATGASPIEAAGLAITTALGNLITNIGKALIKYGIVRLGLDAIFKNPLLMPGGAAIALGVAAIAAGTLVKSIGKAKPFEHGGLVFGPTVGLIGEGRGTNKSNPEIVAPLDHLKKFLNIGNKEPQVIVLAHSLRGNKLSLLQQRQNRRDRRLGG